MAGTSWRVSKCKDCMNMVLSDRWTLDRSKAWCSVRREYYDPNDSACSNHFENDDTKNPPINEGCYLTTIVCEILEYEDDCSILTSLREFRETTLKQNEEYHDLLCEYDIVGPVIAEAIRSSLKPKVLSQFLLTNYIEPTVKCIELDKTDLAVSIYTYMVEELKKLCGIPKIEYDRSLNPTGKGYIKG